MLPRDTSPSEFVLAWELENAPAARDLAGECRRIAADARSLIAWTSAPCVRSLPGVEAERAELDEIADRAEALARRLDSSWA
jgi:hypothetical protein